MKLQKRKIILYAVLVFIVSIVIIGKISYERFQRCEEIEVEISAQKAWQPYKEQQLVTYINQKISDSIIGQLCSDLNLVWLKEELEKNPYVRDVNIYPKSNGVIHVKVDFRRPIAKIYTDKYTLLVDEEGYFFPIQLKNSPYLIVINGDFALNLKKTNMLSPNNNLQYVVDTNTSVLYKAYKLVKYIRHDAFLNDYITQVYIRNGQIQLVPRVGNFIIVFGDIGNYEKKFRNLKAFLHNMDKIGWSKYSIVNLSYENQIVCTKKY